VMVMITRLEPYSIKESICCIQYFYCPPLSLKGDLE
jgi:hypothetical protein